MTDPKPLVIGWRERVALPEWRIRGLLAKSDSGAAHSAIDVEDIEHLPNGQVRFAVILTRKDLSRTRVVEADIVRETVVKSSLGREHQRIVIATDLTIGSVTKPIELGLVRRHKMICRMLLGRSALTPDFLVDSGRTHLQPLPPKAPRSKRPR